MHMTRFCLPANIASTTGPGELFMNLLPWLIALVVVVIVGGAFIYAAKRMLQPSHDSSAEGFTLQSLRDLHAAGELSDEEFAKAREAMIGQVKKAAAGTPTIPRRDNSRASQSADKTEPERDANDDIEGPISR